MELETTTYRVLLKDKGIKGEPIEFRSFPRSEVVKFMDTVKIEPRGCWEWTGYVASNGYGKVRRQGIYKTEWAHRASHMLFKGPIPEGTEIDHLCRNTRCVNPDHLEAVSHTENKRRAAVWTSCDKWHPGQSPRWQQRADGRTYCMECNRAREAERRAAAT